MFVAKYCCAKIFTFSDISYLQEKLSLIRQEEVLLTRQEEMLKQIQEEKEKLLRQEEMIRSRQHDRLKQVRIVKTTPVQLTTFANTCHDLRCWKNIF